MLVAGLSHGAVVESEFLTIDDVLEGIHPNIVIPVGYSDDGATVRVATVREPTREVALSAGIDHQHVAPQRFIRMFLECNVVEFRHVVLNLLLLHDLLDQIFTIVPTPWLIDLTEVFDQEGALPDPTSIYADSSLAFCVDPEGCLVLGQLIVS